MVDKGDVRVTGVPRCRAAPPSPVSILQAAGYFPPRRQPGGRGRVPFSRATAPRTLVPDGPNMREHHAKRKAQAQRYQT